MIALALTILTLVDFIALLWGLREIRRLEERIEELEEEKNNGV
jgi:hypothetical protein